jgi:hypothetical protein
MQGASMERTIIGDRLLKEGIAWCLDHIGSDAKEAKEPGSKIKDQAAWILKFIYQVDAFEEFTLEQQDLYDILWRLMKKDED